jgi:putative methionine-R-sulfoxide reductase with GAF domain
MSARRRNQTGTRPAASRPPPATHADRRALDALAQVCQMVAGDLELKAVMRSAMRAAESAMNAEACTIFRRDAAGERLQFYIVDGPQSGSLVSSTLPINDHSIAGWVARHQEPLLVPDAYRDSRFNRDYDARTGFHTRSIICTPLVAKGRPLGVIQVLNRRDGRSFDEEDLELARPVASLIAVAIYNAEEHEARVNAERLATIGQMMAGMARHVGFSSHDRRWIKFMIEYFPQVEVVCFPFTTMSKTAPTDSLFDALKKCDVGAFGIKPFGAGSLFQGAAEESDRRARLAIRYILLTNTVVPIPGMEKPTQVENVAKAVKERRELDAKEQAELRGVSSRMWANLPPKYEWLRDWEYV